MEDGLVRPVDEGTPQGGPLSPILSNLVLDDLDKELARRGHRFCRYADDCNIYVRSHRAGERVMASVSQFLTNRLRLKVNEAKSAVARPEARKFLGFSISNDGSERRIAPKALDKFKGRIRDMTRRTRGFSLQQLIKELKPYIMGWRGYFGFCQTPRVLTNFEAWIRRRLRLYLWRRWRTRQNRFAELHRRDVAKFPAAVAGLWRISGHPAVRQALRNNGCSATVDGCRTRGTFIHGAARPDPSSEALQWRLDALVAVARFHGTALDHRGFRPSPGEAIPSPAALVAWLHGSGLWAKAVRLRWRQLLRVQSDAPLVLLLNDGSAALLVAKDAARQVVFLKGPRASSDPPIAVDELRLTQLWQGEVLLVRRLRGASPEEEPFTLAWLWRLVLGERRNLREIVVASITLSVLQILPPFLVMVAINRVLTHQSMSTLALIGLILALAVGYETLLGYARREIVEVMSTRLDARLNLHVFSRLLALPVDFFERSPTGETTHRISQIFKIRDFLTGRLVTTLLDVFTLAVLLPVLFWISTTLAWMVLVASAAIALIIAAFLPAIRRVWGKLIAAETKKGAVLVETVHGMRTVKALATENARKLEWDERVAEA